MPEKKTTSKKLKEKTLEAVSSVLPISLLVLVMSLIFVPIDLSTMSLFLFGKNILALRHFICELLSLILGKHHSDIERDCLCAVRT